MKPFPFVALMLLAACAAPPPVFRPVAVDMPVEVPCKIPAIQRPDEPLRHVAPQASLFDKVKAALAEIDNRKAYETQMEAAMAACE
jgi:hypothetical protein